MRLRVLVFLLTALLTASVNAVRAQDTSTGGNDGKSIDGILTALYATVTRNPAQPFDWPRLRALFLPNALIVPTAEQGRQTSPTHTVETFIRWIDTSWAGIIGTARDQGFFEKQIGVTTHTYGDIAIAFSAYEKGYLTSGQVLGRGINALQLVKREGRWWIVSIAWDEQPTAGPIPQEFLQ